jgi:hypothetical protein
VLNQGIRVDISHFLLVLSIFQGNELEQVSHIGTVMKWHTIMLQATVFIRKQNVIAIVQHC